jgi:hypothetical protein
MNKMLNFSILQVCLDCGIICHKFERCYKCKVTNDKIMATRADQIKMEKFLCCCDDDENATECGYCFEKMMAQDCLKNPKTSSHECANCGGHVDNARLCHTCFVNTLI